MSYSRCFYYFSSQQKWCQVVKILRYFTVPSFILRVPYGISEMSTIRDMLCFFASPLSPNTVRPHFHHKRISPEASQSSDLYSRFEQRMVKYSLWGKDVDISIENAIFPTEAELKEMDETLPGAEHGWFENTTGDSLHYRKYLPKDPPKGVCVWQHGIQAHSGVSYKLKNGRITNFALLSRELVLNGYALYTLDMLGHGFSEGKRFYIPEANWKINRDDLDNFARYAAANHKPATPLFVMGESYGGNLALNLSRKWQDSIGDAGARDPPDGFRGFCGIAPAIIGDLPPAPVLFVLRDILAPNFPKWTPFFMPNPISPEVIWGDKEVRELAQSSKDKKANLNGSGQPFRLGTAAGLLSALEFARETAIPGLTVPFCVCHGTDDGGVPIAGTELLMEKSSTRESDRKFQKVEGSRHDLLSESTAEETVETILGWMESRLEMPYIQKN